MFIFHLHMIGHEVMFALSELNKQNGSTYAIMSSRIKKRGKLISFSIETSNFRLTTLFNEIENSFTD